MAFAGESHGLADIVVAADVEEEADVVVVAMAEIVVVAEKSFQNKRKKVNTSVMLWYT